jgi:hypothetical protein
MTDPIPTRLAALKTMALPDLKAEWRTLFGAEPLGWWIWFSRSCSTALTMQTPNSRRDRLRQRVEYWSQMLNATPRIVRKQHMTRKWGSCSASGIVTLSEDLAGKEMGFQDFVIAHELLHLRIPNHGRLFKR